MNAYSFTNAIISTGKIGAFMFYCTIASELRYCPNQQLWQFVRLPPSSIAWKKCFWQSSSPTGICTLTMSLLKTILCFYNSPTNKPVIASFSVSIVTTVYCIVKKTSDTFLLLLSFIRSPPITTPFPRRIHKSTSRLLVRNKVCFLRRCSSQDER